MTTRKTAPNLVLTLVLAVHLFPASAFAAAVEGGGGAAVLSSYTPPEAGDDPRLERTGGGERTLRRVGDAVFARPIFLVRLVAGIVAFPVALPIAAVFADWRDAVDVCVSGPYELVFRRPLGE
jgi:hypothetical protein